MAHRLLYHPPTGTLTPQYYYRWSGKRPVSHFHNDHMSFLTGSLWRVDGRLISPQEGNMKLLRSLLAPVALVAFASPAFAQFNPGATSSTDIALFLGSGLNRPVQMTQAPGQPILDAFCVDFSNHVVTNPEPINITRFDATAAEFNANTRFGFANLDNYKKAAYLTQFFAVSGPL